ncbi:HAMP domain-containing sensor histidine kinase [Hymenobacter sp. GOD-10R]|uniref:sensor histidine kinase n=1 Tax=Hymenobacter sp. GOD-10R TaxID=3093922 RepID=UPI002D79D7E3|nr:HAMP domain-containing sensor histidine kinase [Hymenobacter sp. GOD-10R]WRQ29980.1 HAMP domain-containing sensor histidine kinase [Hymenobacter sp. GOD-10R]
MKLLTATNRYYLGLSAGLFVLCGLLFYGGLQRALRHEVDEQLLNQQAFILRRAQRSGTASALPFAEPPTIHRTRPTRLGFSDTLLLDMLDQALVPHRQFVFAVPDPDGTRWVTLRKSLLETQDILKLVVAVLGLMLALLLLGVVGLNRWLAGRLWSPFRHTLAALRHYDLAQHQPLRLPASSIAEFAELNLALTQMSARLEADYRTLKEFTENAAHETQTPLAIMQAKLEQLMQLPALADPAAAPLLGDLYGATLRLSRLHQGLTLLSKIENRQFPGALPVRLDQLLTEKLHHLRDFIEAKELQVTVMMPSIPTLHLHPALADSLVGNLLQNAVKHNLRGGELRVTLTAEALEVENCGPALPTDNPEQFFERFRKLRTTSDSPGLGLSIVQQVCQYYGFALSYRVTPAPVRHLLRVRF